MKRLLSYLFLVLLSVCSINQSVVFAEAQKMVIMKDNKEFSFETPDVNFTKQLKWSRSSSDDPPFIQKTKGYKEMIELMGTPCFYSREAFTYDGKQIGLNFISKKISSSQENMCVFEVYKIWAEPKNSINYVVGLSANGKAVGEHYYNRKNFIVVVTNGSKRLCIKWASTKGVIDTCYNLTAPQLEFTQIITSRLKAIKLREEAKGNIVVTTTPTEIETSVTDTSGPQIEVPGKLVAKNDQVILSGKITDENNIASVKIDNSPIVLDKEGNFEIAL